MFSIESIRGSSVRVGFCPDRKNYVLHIIVNVRKEGERIIVETPQNCFIRPDIHSSLVGAVLTAYEKSVSGS